MHKRFSGLTLTELLVVILIVALLVAIMLPVVWQVRKRSYQTVCTSNLRQLAAVVSMYREDHDGSLPDLQRRLWSYLKTREMLICPADTTRDGSATVEANHPETPPEQRTKTSYYYVGDEFVFYRRVRENTEVVDYLRRLVEVDPNHGLFVCVLHGEPVFRGGIAVPKHDTKGLVLRARLDGSVQRARVEFVCIQREGWVYGYRLAWQLFTDVRPAPDAIVREHPTLREGQIVPCSAPYE